MLAGIQTLDVGKGTQAGLAIVILAIVIDRISQGFGAPRPAPARAAAPAEGRVARAVPAAAQGAVGGRRFESGDAVVAGIGTEADMATIDVKHVYKLFGPQAAHARVLDLLRSGRRKAEVLAETGCNVGSTT